MKFLVLNIALGTVLGVHAALAGSTAVMADEAKIGLSSDVETLLADLCADQMQLTAAGHDAGAVCDQMRAVMARVSDDCQNPLGLAGAADKSLLPQGGAVPVAQASFGRPATTLNSAAVQVSTGGGAAAVSQGAEVVARSIVTFPSEATTEADGNGVFIARLPQISATDALVERTTDADTGSSLGTDLIAVGAVAPVADIQIVSVPADAATVPADVTPIETETVDGSGQLPVFPSNAAAVTEDPTGNNNLDEQATAPSTPVVIPILASTAGPKGNNGVDGQAVAAANRGDTPAAGPKSNNGVDGQAIAAANRGDTPAAGPKGNNGVDGQAIAAANRGDTPAAGPKGNNGVDGQAIAAANRADTAAAGPKGNNGVDGRGAVQSAAVQAPAASIRPKSGATPVKRTKAAISRAAKPATAKSRKARAVQAATAPAKPETKSLGLVGWLAHNLAEGKERRERARAQAAQSSERVASDNGGGSGNFRGSNGNNAGGNGNGNNAGGNSNGNNAGGNGNGNNAGGNGDGNNAGGNGNGNNAGGNGNGNNAGGNGNGNNAGGNA